MADELLPLIIGFLLTTVLGGLLGSWLQRRTWDHQQEVQLREEELRRADEICQRVSKLLDKRLYRMQRVYFGLATKSEVPGRAARIKKSIEEYDVILHKWNDTLNVNLALMGTYFGETARDWLDTQIYENYKQVGGELEDYYQRMTQGTLDEHSLERIKVNLQALRSQVYRLGVFMMTQLREGNVGRKAPEPVESSPSPGQVRLRSPQEIT